MTEACVKGSIFRNVINDVNDAIADGQLSASKLTEVLKPDEVDQLEHDVAISSWYPAETYCRLLRLLATTARGDRREFLIEGGRESARRVIELGVYAQLDDRTKAQWEDRIGRILVTLSGSFFNFGRWKWVGTEPDGEGFRVDVHEASDFSEELLLRTQGFIEQLANRAADGIVRVTHHTEDDGVTVHFRARRIG